MHASVYCLASSHGLGLTGHFDEGPFPAFDENWMSGSAPVFQITDDRPPRLAVDDLVANATNMSKELFLVLQGAAERMSLARAMGQDVADNFDDAQDDLARVLEAALWQMHPDYGCVLTAQVAELDRQETVALEKARSARLGQPLVLDKPLYDTDGFEHGLVSASTFQIVTRRHGIFTIWDRKTRASLNSGCEGLFLTNIGMTDVERRAETRAALQVLRTSEGQAANPLTRNPASD